MPRWKNSSAGAAVMVGVNVTSFAAVSTTPTTPVSSTSLPPVTGEPVILHFTRPRENATTPAPLFVRFPPKRNGSPFRHVSLDEVRAIQELFGNYVSTPRPDRPAGVEDKSGKGGSDGGPVAGRTPGAAEISAISVAPGGLSDLGGHVPRGGLPVTLGGHIPDQEEIESIGGHRDDRDDPSASGGVDGSMNTINLAFEVVSSCLLFVLLIVVIAFSLKRRSCRSSRSSTQGSYSLRGGVPFPAGGLPGVAAAAGSFTGRSSGPAILEMHNIPGCSGVQGSGSDTDYENVPLTPPPPSGGGSGERRIPVSIL